MVKSMVNSCLPEFLDFTAVFTSVRVLCNGRVQVMFCRVESSRVQTLIAPSPTLIAPSPSRVESFKNDSSRVESFL